MTKTKIILTIIAGIILCIVSYDMGSQRNFVPIISPGMGAPL